MIGTLESVVVDCPDPTELANFYAQLIGGRVHDEDGDGHWVTLKTHHGTTLAFQRAMNHRPPKWPDPAHPQQFHLDLRVEDLDKAQEQALGIGAKLLEDNGGQEFGYRVFADPAGHPFCLVRD